MNKWKTAFFISLSFLFVIVVHNCITLFSDRPASAELNPEYTISNSELMEDDMRTLSEILKRNVITKSQVIVLLQQDSIHFTETAKNKIELNRLELQFGDNEVLTGIKRFW